MSNNSISFRKPVNIIRSLDEDQRKALDLFLFSKFFKFPNEVIWVYKLVKKELKDSAFIGFEKKQLEKLFKKISTGKKYDPKISIYFNEAIDKFLILNQLNQETFSKQHLLLKAYSKLGLHDLFQKTSKKTMNGLKKKQPTENSFHIKNFLLHQTIYFHPHTDKSSKSVFSQEQMIHHLDAFFYLNKLQLGIEISQRKNYLDENKSLSELKEAIIFGKKYKSPHFTFYILLIEIIQNKSQFQEQKFLKIQFLFEENLSIWNFTNQRNFFQFLVNYLTSFINQNVLVARELLLDLFRFGLKKNLILDHNNSITTFSFTNLVTIFSNSEAFKEAELIIQEYQNFLPQTDKKNTVLFSEAYLSLSKEDFENAIQTFQLISFKSDVHKLNMRCYMIRTSFEQRIIDKTYQGVFSASLASFNKLISKNKELNSIRKRSYLNLINAITALYKIAKMSPKTPLYHSKLNQLKIQIKNPEDPILMKPWILKKIQDIKKRRKSI